MNLEDVHRKTEFARVVRALKDKDGGLPALLPKRLLPFFSKLRSEGSEVLKGVTYGYNTALADNHPNRNDYWLLPIPEKAESED